MKPLREITAEEENFRLEPVPGAGFRIIRREPVKPVPEGTIILMAFRVECYAQDCDGSLMAQVAQIDNSGRETGWTQNCIGLYPETALVLDGAEELASLWRVGS